MCLKEWKDELTKTASLSKGLKKCFPNGLGSLLGNDREMMIMTSDSYAFPP